MRTRRTLLACVVFEGIVRVGLYRRAIRRRELLGGHLEQRRSDMPSMRGLPETDPRVRSSVDSFDVDARVVGEKMESLLVQVACSKRLGEFAVEQAIVRFVRGHCRLVVDIGEYW